MLANASKLWFRKPYPGFVHSAREDFPANRFFSTGGTYLASSLQEFWKGGSFVAAVLRGVDMD